ncbi:MAG: hypothetical protein AB7R89_29775 [Dehalococcoidia bacterium]
MSPDETRPEMTAGASAAREHQQYRLIALALLGLVLAALVGAFLLDRRVRPRVGIDPTAAIPAVAEATAPIGAVSMPPAASMVPTATAAAVPSSVRVARSPLEREIEDAYFHYWDVLAQAYLNLDPSGLADVTSGAELTRQEQQVRDLRAQGKAAKLIADHHLIFVEVSVDRAVIYDEYLNRSIFVDPVTKQELPTRDPPETEKISFQMRKINGVWKIVDGRRHE